MTSVDRIGVFFDLDGLILDSEPLQLLATNRALASIGVRITSDEWSKYVGSPTIANLRAIVRRVGARVDLRELERRKDAAYAAACAHRLATRTGVELLVRQLDAEGFVLAVVTSSVLSDAERLLAQVELREHFNLIVAGDRVTAGKPAPEPYVLACRMAGLPARRCVALEDSRNGVLSAVGAGLACVAVPNRFTRRQDLTPADVVVEEFKQLDGQRLRGLVLRRLSGEAT